MKQTKKHHDSTPASLAFLLEPRIMLDAAMFGGGCDTITSHASAAIGNVSEDKKADAEVIQESFYSHQEISWMLLELSDEHADLTHTPLEDSVAHAETQNDEYSYLGPSPFAYMDKRDYLYGYHSLLTEDETQTGQYKEPIDSNGLLLSQALLQFDVKQVKDRPGFIRHENVQSDQNYYVSEKADKLLESLIH